MKKKVHFRNVFKTIGGDKIMQREAATTKKTICWVMTFRQRGNEKRRKSIPAGKIRGAPSDLRHH
jgi:hypothetical protein